MNAIFNIARSDNYWCIFGNWEIKSPPFKIAIQLW